MELVTFLSSIHKNKNLAVLMGLIGVGGISYGMLRDNDPIFIIGLFLIAGGYLLLRKRIKESNRKKT